jgi:hypothetical protein
MKKGKNFLFAFIRLFSSALTSLLSSTGSAIQRTARALGPGGYNAVHGHGSTAGMGGILRRGSINLGDTIAISGIRHAIQAVSLELQSH